MEPFSDILGPIGDILGPSESEGKSTTKGPNEPYKDFSPYKGILRKESLSVTRFWCSVRTKYFLAPFLVLQLAYYRCNNYVAKWKTFTKKKLWHHSYQDLWFAQMVYVYAKFRAWCHSFQPITDPDNCHVRVFCFFLWTFFTWPRSYYNDNKNERYN